MLSRARVLRGELQYERGAWSDALADLKAAFEASEALGDAGGRAYALTAIANLYGSAGEHAKALDYYQQTLTLARETGRRDNEATALYNLGVTQDKLGNPDAALRHYREALAVQRAADLAGDIPDSLRSMAISLIKLERAGEALALLDEADGLPPVQADPGMRAALKLTRGAALRHLDRPTEALGLLDSAREWFETTQAAPFLEKIEDERARALKALGRHAEALAARERQIELKDAMHQAWRAEQTARLRVEFDTDRFEQQNRALATENALRAEALRAAERIRTLQSWVIASAALTLLALGGLALVQVRNARRLRRIALTDELTGLPNRRATLDYARRQVERRARERMPLSVVALDIDHFKRINDTFGHDAGDLVLRRVAAALRHFDRGWSGASAARSFLRCCRISTAPAAPRWPSRCGGSSKASTSARSNPGCASVPASASPRSRAARAGKRPRGARTRRSIAPSMPGAIAWRYAPPENRLLRPHDDPPRLDREPAFKRRPNLCPLAFSTMAFADNRRARLSQRTMITRCRSCRSADGSSLYRTFAA
ncbi:MAG: GGDEF domain-containing protein [Rhodanobacteraceae bacterium]|nr:GGDEF domain-containing protein [Rhodanobacteraceae bacterium]